MKTISKVISLIVILSFIAACKPAETPEPTTIPPTAKPTEPPPPTPTEAPPPVELEIEFTDEASGITASFPAEWTAVSNYEGVGVTGLSVDWAGVTIITLKYDEGVTAEGLLAERQDYLESGVEFADVVVTPDVKATVFGQEWDAFKWDGYYTAVEVDYSGLEVVVPYGQQFIHITTYAPTDQWQDYAPIFDAIRASIVEPAADFAYTPPPAETEWQTYLDPATKLVVYYPPEWLDPMPPWEGQGVWLNASDYLTSVVIWVVEGDDPVQMLADWETTQLVFNEITVEDGDPLTILGEERAIKTGSGLNAFGTKVNFGVTYIPFNEQMLYIVWYATSEDGMWDAAAETFPTILTSLEPIPSYTSEDYQLTVLQPPDWIEPAAPWEGEGIWLNAPDYLTSVVIWVVDGTDAAQMLADWETTQMVFNEITVEDGEAIMILGEERATKTCSGLNAFGSEIQCGVTYVPHDAKMLYIVWYATAGETWEAGQPIFDLILTTMTSP
jgi:hypothetical protein